jgi:hypothetical protein
MSAVFHLFVIEARIVRCLAPFFALLCGGCTAELHRIGGVGRVLQWMVGGALVVFAGIHFIIPLRQWYPESFYAHAKEIAAIQPDGVRLLALNDHSTPTLVFPEEYPAEAILFSRPHPYQYAPFQYEGITPEVRRRYQTYDFPMQVVRVRSPVLRWTSAPGFDLGKYPGPLRLMLQLPHNGTGLGDPLVVTGFARGADWLTVLRDGPNSFRFQFRHWGDGVLVSEPITLDEQIEHTLVVSLGSMMPPGEAPIYRLHPELGILQQHLFLSVDQHIVFDQSQAFFPCKPVDIEVGHNSIDGTVTEVRFRGRIASVDGLPPTDVPRLFEAPASKIFVADLNSYPGPIRARLRLSGSGSDAEPLLATGSDGASDHLRLVHLGSNRFRVDFHHAGAPILSSSVIELDEMMEHSIEISLGSLMPPASSAVYQRKPETTLLRHWLFVAIDGRRIFDRDQSFHSTTTASIHFGRSVNGESPVLARGEERLVEVRPLPCAELLVKL